MAVVIMDGAIGSNLMENAGDVVSQLSLTDEARVLALHKSYIDAGANVICSNTFSANRYGKLTFPLADVVAKGVELAKKAAEGKGEVALDIGPFSELLEPYGDLSEEDCENQYREILTAGAAEKPDYIFFETFMDLNMLELAVKQAVPFGIPILCSMTFMEIGKTMMGNSVQDMVDRLSQYPLKAIGLNCSLEPNLSLPIAKTFRKYTDLPIVFKPNAGLPQFEEGDICYEDANLFAQQFSGIEELGDVWIGGCCGSTEKHVRRLAVHYCK